MARHWVKMGFCNIRSTGDTAGQALFILQITHQGATKSAAWSLCGATSGDKCRATGQPGGREAVMVEQGHPRATLPAVVLSSRHAGFKGGRGCPHGTQDSHTVPRPCLDHAPSHAPSGELV